MVCKGASQVYLKWLNSLIILIGLLLLALGVFCIVELKAELEAVSQIAPFIGVIAGAAVLVVGILGCWGASAQNKFILFVYWIIMTVVTVAVLAAGAAFMTQVGLLKDLEVGNSAAIVDEAEAKINDFTLAVYDSCCPDSPAVQACAENTVGACFKDKAFFDETVARIGPEVCAALAEVKIEDIALVGPVGEVNGCASPEIFQGMITTYLDDNILPIGIGFIVISVILLLVDICTCCLICTNREDYDAEYRQRVQQQNGGAVAGTGGPGVKYV